MPNTIYRLHFNENPLGPSPKVIDAINGHAPNLGAYPTRDDEKLRHVLAEFYGNGLTPNHFYSTYSGSEGLDLIARIYLSPGDEGIICKPTFGVYQVTAGWQNAKIVDVPLDPDHFTLRVDDILAAVNDRTRLIYLGNPNNPTGTIITHDEMERLYATLPEEVMIVSDEVYYQFVRNPAYPDSLAAVMADRKVLVLHSFSKAYGLAGLRIGIVIAQPDIISHLVHLRRTFHLGTLEMEAAIAAIGDQNHINNSVDLAWSGKQWLYDQFERLGLKTWPSEANFILFRTAIPSDEVADRLSQEGILVGPGTRFGIPNCIRVSVGQPEANEAFIKALEKVM